MWIYRSRRHQCVRVTEYSAFSRQIDIIWSTQLSGLSANHDFKHHFRVKLHFIQLPDIIKCEVNGISAIHITTTENRSKRLPDEKKKVQRHGTKKLEKCKFHSQKNYFVCVIIPSCASCYVSLFVRLLFLEYTFRLRDTYAVFYPPFWFIFLPTLRRHRAKSITTGGSSRCVGVCILLNIGYSWVSSLNMQYNTTQVFCPLRGHRRPNINRTTDMAFTLLELLCPKTIDSIRPLFVANCHTSRERQMKLVHSIALTLKKWFWKKIDWTMVVWEVNCWAVDAQL